MKNILILGVSGLIGSNIFKAIFDDPELNVFGACRSSNIKIFFKAHQRFNIYEKIDVLQLEDVRLLLNKVRPDVIINCVGVTKHLPGALDPLVLIPINSLWPHQLALLADEFSSKLIQISTDCVFSGDKGGYTESDCPDAIDFYGKSKIFGEINHGHHLTLRISTIGHELQSCYGLLDWFLSQSKECYGYSNAFFSGLPSTYFGLILREFIIPREDLKGLYHIASKRIDKFSLLHLIALEYGKNIKIIGDGGVRVDRSLNGDRFSKETGFIVPEWPQLIKGMHLKY